MWKGAIGFGLVSIPVNLVAATGSHDLRLHQVHAADGGRVRNRRRCEVCGEEVAQADLAKGYEAPGGKQAVLTDDDLEDLPLPSKKLIDVLAFIDESEIDPIHFERAYYISPQPQTPADKPYVLLRDTMREGRKVAVTRVAIGTRETPAVIRVSGDLLQLHTMHWPDEIREQPHPADGVTSRPQEQKMMAQLMDRLGADFNLGDEVDERQRALTELVTAKLEGTEPPHGRTEEPDTSEPVDLMAALQASLGQTDAPEKAKKRGKKPSRRKAG